MITVKKKNHVKANCWAEGGGKAGQGPKQKFQKRKANKAEERSANEYNAAYSVRENNDTVLNKANKRGNLTNPIWLADSAATSHICPDRNSFRDYSTYHGEVAGLGGNSLNIIGIGTVYIKVKGRGDQYYTHKLERTLHVPNADTALLSLTAFDRKGGVTICGNGECQLTLNGKIIGIGKQEGQLYHLEVEQPYLEAANVARNSKSSWDEWHERLGHISISSMQKLKSGDYVTGLDIDDSTTPNPTCQACVEGKASRRSFPAEASTRSEIPGELTYMDTWGPAPVTSVGGSRYYISATDDCSRHAWMIFLKAKNEAFEKIKAHIAYLENRYGRTPKILRFDNGTEFFNNEMKSWAASKGIELQTTAPYSPSQNGIAERYNRTIIELARAMLFSANLPKFLWAEAAAHACYIRNRCATRALKGKTPYEAWNGKKPDISHFRKFGQDVYVLEEVRESKLDRKARKVKFLAFLDGPKAIKYYDPERARFIGVSRNFTWDDSVAPGPLYINTSTTIDKPQSLPSEGGINETIENIAPEAPEANQTPARSLIPRRSGRNTRDHNYRRLANPQSRLEATERQRTDGPITEPELPVQVEQANLTRSYASAELPDDNPRTLKEAQASPDWPHWKEAMKAEIDQFATMGTYTLQDMPKDREAVKNRWVFLKKYDSEGKVINTRHDL